MTVISKAIWLVVALAASVLLATPSFAQGEGEAKVRVAHLSPDAPNADVYVDGEPLSEVQDVAYGTVSSYLPLRAGTHNVKMYAAGDSSRPLLEAELDLRDGVAYTVAAVGLAGDDSLQAQVYEDDDSLPATDDAKLRVIHASPDVAAVDIGPEKQDDLFTHLGYPNATKYAEIPAGTYPLEGTLAGTNEEAFKVEATLAPQTVYTAFGIGLAEEGTFEVKLVKDAGAGGGLRSDEPTPVTGGFSPAWVLLVALLLAATVSSAAWSLVKGAR
jgi:Domain of unknown function (DUF4397)